MYNGIADSLKFNSYDGEGLDYNILSYRYKYNQLYIINLIYVLQFVFYDFRK